MTENRGIQQRSDSNVFKQHKAFEDIKEITNDERKQLDLVVFKKKN